MHFTNRNKRSKKVERNASRPPFQQVRIRLYPQVVSVSELPHFILFQTPCAMQLSLPNLNYKTS